MQVTVDANYVAIKELVILIKPRHSQYTCETSWPVQQQYIGYDLRYNNTTILRNHSRWTIIKNKGGILTLSTRITTNTLRQHFAPHVGVSVVAVSGGVASGDLFVCIYDTSMRGKPLLDVYNTTIITPHYEDSKLSYSLDVKTGVLSETRGDSLMFTMETTVTHIADSNTKYQTLCIPAATAITRLCIENEIGSCFVNITNRYNDNTLPQIPGQCWQQWDIKLPQSTINTLKSGIIGIKFRIILTDAVTFAVHIRAPFIKAAHLTNQRNTMFGIQETTPIHLRLVSTQTQQAMKDIMLIPTIDNSDTISILNHNNVRNLVTVFTDAEETCIELTLDGDNIDANTAGIDIVSANMEVCYGQQCDETLMIPLVTAGRVTKDFYHYAMGRLVQFSSGTTNATKLCYTPEISRQGEIHITWRAVDKYLNYIPTSPVSIPNTITTPSTPTTNRLHYTTPITQIQQQPPTPQQKSIWCEDHAVHCDGTLSMNTIVACHHDYTYRPELGRCVAGIDDTFNALIGAIVISLIITCSFGIIVATPSPT